ncbi:MAG: HAD hydrolase family protein [FCB group bacterium]|nr:HAD hydrolase family protein [FCB group bacterium]
MKNPDISAKLQKIKLLVSDVDGVLTDGNIEIHSDGVESKKFTVKDGAGVALGRIAGIPVAFLSARHSEATTIRAAEMGIRYCIQGRLDKLAAFHEICAHYNIDPLQAAYIGDGLVDIPVLENCGCAFAPADCHPLVAAVADQLTELRGGEGVLHAVVEIILAGQNRLTETMDQMRSKVYRG